jgi:hypothetical protein
MIWGLIGLAVVVALVVLALTRDNVGIAIPVAAATVFLIVASLAWYQNREVAEAKSRIPAAEVELADMQLNDEARGVKLLTGRIRNHSRQYTLTQLQVQVSLEDCLNDHCEVINQTEVNLKPEVPPGQARDFRERIAFPSAVAPRGLTRLSYQVIATRGD